VSAALDAVKERVQLPWIAAPKVVSPVDLENVILKPEVPFQSPGNLQDSGNTRLEESAELELSDGAVRMLTNANFEKALKEITPSGSETLGSLADLRRWNDEFGEGRKDKRKHQIWGKDRFGFGRQILTVEEDGRVLPAPPS
jgi:hypothetical protein